MFAEGTRCQRNTPRRIDVAKVAACSPTSCKAVKYPGARVQDINQAMTGTGDIVLSVLVLQGKGDEYHSFDGLDVERSVPAGGMCVREASNRAQIAVIRVNGALAKVRHQQDWPI